MPDQSSASRVSGKAFRVFQHAGKRYVLSQPLRMASHAEQVQVVLFLRRDVASYAVTVVQRLPATMHAAVWTGCFAAYQQGIPSEDEWAAYDSSSWHTAYLLWTCLDPKHKTNPETQQPFDILEGVQWAYNFYTDLPSGEKTVLLKLVSEVSQENELKNSAGLTVGEAVGPDQPPADQSTTDLSQSMNSSPEQTKAE